MEFDTQLSVLMMAYNQGEFIHEAIESVLSQDLPFNWELVIGDDASTDSTEEIVKSYLIKYPENIKYFKHGKNIGLHANYIFLISKCRGKFIALLEGDDYWIDPKKTVSQVDFMEKNPTVSWSFTDGKVVNEIGDIQQHISYNLPKIFNIEFYLENFFNPLNNSVVFRKSVEPLIYPDFFSKVAQWDTVLHYLRTSNGEIGYIPINGLAWRRHSKATSFTSSFSGIKRYEDWIKINKNIKPYLPKYLHKYFKTNFIAYEFISIKYFQDKRPILFFVNFLKMVINKPFRSVSFYRDYIWKLKNR